MHELNAQPELIPVIIITQVRIARRHRCELEKAEKEEDRDRKSDGVKANSVHGNASVHGPK